MHAGMVARQAHMRKQQLARKNSYMSKGVDLREAQPDVGAASRLTKARVPRVLEPRM